MTQSIPQLPDALRLANYLEKEWVTGDCLNAARELRRLHAENAALAAQPQSFSKLYEENAQGIEIERLKLRIEELEAARPGMALVPIEPTPAMCRAFLSAVGRHTPYSAGDPAICDGYHAMVAAAPQPQNKPGLTVSVCHLSDGDDPFVFECHGRVTASVLADIDKALLENRDTHFPNGPGDYEFSLTWYKGQYGFEGRCELAPGWEFEQIGFKPLALPPADEFPHTEVEVSGHKFLVVDLPTTFFDDKAAPSGGDAAAQGALPPGRGMVPQPMSTCTKEALEGLEDKGHALLWARGLIAPRLTDLAQFEPYWTEFHWWSCMHYPHRGDPCHSGSWKIDPLPMDNIERIEATHWQPRPDAPSIGSSAQGVDHG